MVLSKHLHRFLWLAVLIGILPTGSLRGEENTWTTSGFLDFSDGTLADGGVNTYIAADGTIRLFNLWDLNNDGNFDLPVACPQDHDESVDLFIYWADDKGYDPARRTRLPTTGAIGGAAADLNGDGHVDLMVANRFDGVRTDLDATIYWGSEKGFAASHRSNLPAKAAQAIAAADLNGDGQLDVVVANRGVDYHMTDDNFQKSYIYWGSPQGYSAKRRDSLHTVNCLAVTIADVNRDSHPDILFVNQGNDLSESGVVIYLGDGKGNYHERHSTKLPGIYSSSIAVADLNADGHLEIILANMYRIGTNPALPIYNNVETYRVNSYIYWGSAEGHSIDRRTELPTIGAQAVTVGDLNGDGLPDVAFANSAEGVSFIYWNGPQGFSAHRLSQVLSPGAHDVAIEDLNRDGHPDLILANYASNGFFDTASYIYWGEADGIRGDRLTKLPTSGASGIVVADLNGNGLKDLVFINKIEGVSFPGGTTSSIADFGPTTSWIYWGDDQGRFDPGRRQGIATTRGADGYVNSDLNGDGHVDLLFAHGGSPTIIYWGSSDGFSSANKSNVPDARSGTGRVADVNRDGYLDLLLNSAVIFGQKSGFSRVNRFVFAPETKYPSFADLNRDGWLDVVSPLHDKVILFWNSPAGFDNQRTSILPMPGKFASMAETADFNQDGFLDLVVVTHIDYHKPLGPGEAATLHGNPNADSYIYWGSREGYSAARRLALPTVGANDAVAADLNADGYVDLFFPSYLAGNHRDHPGYIYWNGPEGFDAQRRTLIPMFSGCGTLAADCNLDGHQDLIIANHTRVGNHRSDVWVYWGSAKGYSAQQRTSLPAAGPHFFSQIDIGNVYDRSDRYDYISPPFDSGGTTQWKRISWQAGKQTLRIALGWNCRFGQRPLVMN